MALDFLLGPVLVFLDEHEDGPDTGQAGGDEINADIGNWDNE